MYHLDSNSAPSGAKPYENIVEAASKVSKEGLSVPSRQTLADYLKYGSSSQVDRFYSQINTQLVKRVVVDKFTKEAETLSTRKKRERQRLLTETTKDLLSGFKVLSRVYFNKSKGDQLLTSEFQDIVSDFGVKDLLVRKAHINSEKEKLRFLQDGNESEYPERQNSTVLSKSKELGSNHSTKYLPRNKVGILGKYLRKNDNRNTSEPQEDLQTSKNSGSPTHLTV